MNRFLPDLQTIRVHKFGKAAVTRLVYQHKGWNTFDGQPATDQEKISQMGAEEKHSLALGQSGINIFAPNKGNPRAHFLIGRFYRGTDFDAGAKKIAQAAARDSVDYRSVQVCS